MILYYWAWAQTEKQKLAKKDLVLDRSAWTHRTSQMEKPLCTCKHCCLCVKCCHLLGFIRRHCTSSRPHLTMPPRRKIEQFWQGTSCCMVPRWCYQARSGQASTGIHLSHCQTDSTLHSHWEGPGTTQIWLTEEDKPTWRSSHWTTSPADKNSLLQHHSKAHEGGC